MYNIVKTSQQLKMYVLLYVCCAVNLYFRVPINIPEFSPKRDCLKLLYIDLDNETNAPNFSTLEEVTAQWSDRLKEVVPDGIGFTEISRGNYCVITLAMSGTGTGTGTRTRKMGDNRCRPLSLFRCSVKGST